SSVPADSGNDRCAHRSSRATGAPASVRKSTRRCPSTVRFSKARCSSSGKATTYHSFFTKGVFPSAIWRIAAVAARIHPAAGRLMHLPYPYGPPPSVICEVDSPGCYTDAAVKDESLIELIASVGEADFPAQALAFINSRLAADHLSLFVFDAA